MTIAMKSPGRHQEILTQRTGNRISSLDTDCPSDSCIDIEDHSKLKPARPSPASTTSTTTPRSFHSVNGGSSPQRRRRKRRANGTLISNFWRILVADLSILGLFCVFFFIFHFGQSSDNSADSSSSTKNPQVQFWKESLTGSGSCSLPLESSQVSYTLVTQVSADRLWMMEHQCERWRIMNDNNETISLPISIAVFTNSTNSQVKHDLYEMGCDMAKIRVQTLDAKLFSLQDYPVNQLRNLAMKQVQTSHAVLVDIDFWISQDLPVALQRDEVIDVMAEDPKATLVIPAFMLFRQCHQWRECPEENIPYMPKTLRELIRQVRAKKVTRFDPTNQGGHGSTKYIEWFHQNKEEEDTLLQIDCFLSNRYEPYLVFRVCHELPPFQEPFTGYGKNKMTWVMQLRRLGYQFWQLGKGAFVCHYPHLDSPSRMAWNDAPDKHNKNINWMDYKRGRMDQLFVEFREWLRLEIPDETKVPFCEDKLDDDAKLLYDRKAFNATRRIGSASAAQS